MAIVIVNGRSRNWYYVDCKTAQDILDAVANAGDAPVKVVAR